MNRWVLLKHTIGDLNNHDFHFDFLVEHGNDCLTWKMFKLPKKNGESVEIFDQMNHRLFWLSQNEKKLSRNRGFVKRIDYGFYISSGGKLDTENFSLHLDGQLLLGFLKKSGNLCKLI